MRRRIAGKDRVRAEPLDFDFRGIHRPLSHFRQIGRRRATSEIEAHTGRMPEARLDSSRLSLREGSEMLKKVTGGFWVVAALAMLGATVLSTPGFAQTKFSGKDPFPKKLKKSNSYLQVSNITIPAKNTTT